MDIIRWGTAILAGIGTTAIILAVWDIFCRWRSGYYRRAFGSEAYAQHASGSEPDAERPSVPPLIIAIPFQTKDGHQQIAVLTAVPTDRETETARSVMDMEERDACAPVTIDRSEMH